MYRGLASMRRYRRESDHGSVGGESRGVRAVVVPGMLGRIVDR